MKFKIMLMIFLLLIPILGKNEKINPEKNPKEFFMYSDPSHEDLYYEILSKEIKFPEIAFAQILIETGNLKSNLYKKYNNLFGMKFPRKRETLSIGKISSGYAKYDNWMDSIQDYKLWQTYMIKEKDLSRKEYLSLLGRVYASDVSYTSKIEKKILQYKHLFN